MKAKALKSFRDSRAGVVRMAGSTFECSEERFAEISAKLDGFVEEVKEQAPAKRTRKTRLKK